VAEGVLCHLRPYPAFIDPNFTDTINEATDTDLLFLLDTAGVPGNLRIALRREGVLELEVADDGTTFRVRFSEPDRRNS